MDKSLLLAGGAILVAGGFAYWYLSQQQQQKCTSGEKKCVGNDLYICQNNKWILYEEDSEQCNGNGEHCQYLLPGDDPGYGYPSGWQVCNAPTTELCKWNNATKKWSLVTENSSYCQDPSNPITYRKCYVSSATNYCTCGEFPGDLSDECDSYGRGCDCHIGKCQPNTWCCSDYKCQLTALQMTLACNDNNWSKVKMQEGGNCGYSATYTLENPVAASTLSGQLYWDNGFFGFSQSWFIDVFYNNTWTTVWTKGWQWVLSGSGQETVEENGGPLIFDDILCIKKIRFTVLANNSGICPKPTSFVGWLNY